MNAHRPGGVITAVRVREVHVVLPGEVADPTLPSGGNTYDRRVCAGLMESGWSVRPLLVAGSWPCPAAADRARLAGALAGIPDGATVLLDGLVACGVPDVVVPHARRLRLVVLVHLPLADETGLAEADAAALDAAERRMLRAAAAVVATSAAVGRRLLDHHGLPPARVRVAIPGVDPAPLTVGGEDGGRLLYVASVTPRKGLDVLVRALAGVADLSWTCVCAGPLDRDPEYAAEVRTELLDLRLADRVALVGPRTDAEVGQLYGQSDLLILPSRAEPYGMVVTEALARGLPVVGSAVGGIPEALGLAPGGEFPGVLVAPGDPVALAGVLRSWLGAPAVRARLRAAARARRSGLHDWEDTTAALASVLEQAGIWPFGMEQADPEHVAIAGAHHG
jgi:glycosyltransferase involved in cell wall biosynthesis